MIEGSSGDGIDMIIKTEITVQNNLKVPDLPTVFHRQR